MRVTKDKLEKASQDLLRFLDRKKVISLSDLDNLAGESHSADGEILFRIAVKKHKVNGDPASYWIRCSTQNRFSIIDVIFDEQRSYAMVYVKTTDALNAYRPTAVISPDQHGNVCQSRYFSSITIEQIKQELNNLKQSA